MDKFCSKCDKELVGGRCECSSDMRVIDRKRLKEAAKDKLNNNMWNLWIGILVVMGVSTLISMFANNFSMFNISVDGETSLNLLELLFSIFTVPLSAGLTYYVLSFVRGEAFDLSDLFKFYKDRMWVIILSSIVVSIMVFLGSILFVIPGIIVTLMYSMITFIYVDSEENDVRGLLNKSKNMMYGYKWDYFVFQLSFIGWGLLCLFIIPIIYVLPYYYVANTMYYEELKRIKE